MVRDTCVRLYRKFLAWFQGDEEDGPLEFLGVQDDHGFWSCRFCSRSGMQKKYPDLFRHVWREHYWVTDEDEPKNESSSAETRHDDFSVGDYVEDYSLPESEDEETGIEIQEATGRAHMSKFNNLRKYYEGVVQEIEQNGRMVIQKQTHIGTARGFDIKRYFRQAVRRHPEDSLENYEFVRDRKGSYPVIIERS